MSLLFIYGSLIREHSKAALAARVSDLRRGWNVPIPEDRDTGLGLVASDQATCNGALLFVDEDSLQEVDEREEQHAYRRVEIPRSAISLPTTELLGPIWTYVFDSPTAASEECPISQSYVDCVLDGFLRLGEPFAREFVSSTDGWDRPWVDDRAHPRYRRATQVDVEPIDRLLSEMLPREFAGRSKG